MATNEATQHCSKPSSPRKSVIVSNENVHHSDEEALFVHDNNRQPHHADHEGFNPEHYVHISA